MLEKLDFLSEKYDDLNQKISDPEVIADQAKWQKLMKEHAHLEPIIAHYMAYKKASEGIEESKEMLLDKALDKEFKELCEMELSELTEEKERLEEELKVLLLPKDPNDDKNVIVEIRAGAGGSEAALFAGDLFRMFTRYAERHRWKSEIMNSNIPDIGGIKEITFAIEGQGAYSRLKYESGVHRVQRIPSTESGGRIHTSTATVAVLPEVDDVEVEINPNDIRVDVYRSSGNGGQCVNTTDSAVRLTHEPTGLVVTCQDEKSQLKNKEKAMKVLKARLYEIEMQKQQSEIAKDRKSQVGTGDRSERIRTYNFPQGRVTDHRIGMTVHQLDAFLDGEIDEMVDALITSDQAEKMKAGL
ncbi:MULTISPECIES: peptide chain release factor 1 [Eubacterium]|uniref:Peptide chain release factor 1 n=2 Tax=Eubacterium TaxID=1730 RepID=A0A1H4B4J5_9FIRM|nr:MULTISPECIES: peptide chain release factor 1 [Eubacterium]MDD4690664.1 peptide chain release factor 1 [Eubacterium aggregans]MEA5073438.1 peptide chain release factor 1 [Eubacterium aggregans]SDX40070.1 bacterial peptide chain release factor 1 (bRF-1) [Eubacterium barkeri]SEA43037.1 bacterial peptide chain release factor 1 (bRF-1) [Eubacterium aggregans]